MHLEIVTHSYRYAKLLSFQLSSLLAFRRTDMTVTATVFFCDEDERTQSVLRHYLQANLPFTLNPWCIERVSLLRRAIGRNLAALATAADWVWFTDADFVFGPGCLESLPELLDQVRGPLAYPSATLVTSQQRGDQLIRTIGNPVQEPWFHPRDFTFVPGTSNAGRATGAIQIVRGEVARSSGYLHGHAVFQRPADTWQRTRCDVEFRRSLSADRRDIPGEPIALPNLFRIRHSQRGRETPEIDL